MAFGGGRGEGGWGMGDGGWEVYIHRSMDFSFFPRPCIPVGCGVGDEGGD